MNHLSKDIQSIIYRYIHQDALQRGFHEIFPITTTSSPFSMDVIDFTNNKGLVECIRFKSDMCTMCYKRNIDKSRPLESWIRCYDILSSLNTITSIYDKLYLAWTYTDLANHTTIVKLHQIMPNITNVYGNVYRESMLTSSDENYITFYTN
jgi:hypothetical protein